MRNKDFLYEQYSGSVQEEKVGDSSVFSKEERKGVVGVASCLVKIRKKPSPLAKVLGYVEKGEKVTILGKDAGYYEIRAGNIHGYLSAEYCTEV